MDIYIIVVIVTLLIQLIPVRNNKQYIYKLIFSFLPLFLFGALRKDFNDYLVYKTAFENLDLTRVVKHFEIGYYIFNKIMPTFNILIVVQSLFVCAAYGFFFYRYVPKDKTLFAFVFFFLAGQYTVFFMYSALRNAMAISVLIFSIPLVERRMWKNYIVAVLLAASFHTSSLLVLPFLYFICRDTPMNESEFIVWIVVMVVLVILPLNYIFEKADMFFTVYMDRYVSYTKKIVKEDRTISTLILTTTTVLSVCTLMFARSSEDKKTLLLSRLTLICLYANYLGALNMRLTNYLEFFYVCFLADVMYCKKYNRFVKYVFVCLSVAYLSYAFFYVFLGSESFSYQEYHFIFE